MMKGTAISRKQKIAVSSSSDSGRNPSDLSARDRLLKSAKTLFAKKGFRDASIRDIAAHAGVNSAAVGYYFQGKIRLFDAVYESYAVPLAKERIKQLLAITKEGRQLSIEEVLKAWILPWVESANKGHDPNLYFQLADERWAMQMKIRSVTSARVNRAFIDALQQCLPQFSRKTLYWRMHFTVGAIQFVVHAANSLRTFSKEECEPSDLEAAVNELLSYAVAGFSAAEASASPMRSNGDYAL
jgi:AcrR family transcriptional regulator